MAGTETVLEITTLQFGAVQPYRNVESAPKAKAKLEEIIARIPHARDIEWFTAATPTDDPIEWRWVVAFKCRANIVTAVNGAPTEWAKYRLTEGVTPAYLPEIA